MRPKPSMHDARAERGGERGEARNRIGRRHGLVLLHLEEHAVARNAARRELRGNEFRKSRVGEGLRRKVEAQPRDARADGEPGERPAQHQAIELRHEAVVLEHREELAGRQHRMLLFAQANEHLAHRVRPHEAGEGGDRLAIKLERLLGERLPQVGDGIVRFHGSGKFTERRRARCQRLLAGEKKNPARAGSEGNGPRFWRPGRACQGGGGPAAIEPLGCCVASAPG